MSQVPPTSGNSKTQPTTSLCKLLFTHGIEVENFITNKSGDILEDGKELVAVWDQMFNGAFNFLKSLTSSTKKVPEYIRKKIKRVVRKDVKRHGKIIHYVQMHYQFNGKTIEINVFGPDPNISQITWLLELVTPPCEYLEELEWWINTLYIAASRSITKGYNIQPIGFNPFQTEYRAGVTCGEHHHLGGFKSEKEKKTVYNMIRAYIPHLIALSNTSPFLDGKTSGRTLLKRSNDGRTMILAPDCVRSYRLKENSGQLGPNIPEYLPHASPTFTRNQFSRYVRKEVPDDRYVDAFPFTSYGTIEFRFFDAQYDQNIRNSIIILLQALALKARKLHQTGTLLPEVKGNTLYEHRKRAVNFGMFAKFQGDPSIESAGGEFVKHYNHNPESGGPPGKIYESLRSLLIWLKPELKELKVTDRDVSSLLIMLWGTPRIAPPISAATYMIYLYEQNHKNIANVVRSLALINGKPRRTFSESLGRSEYSLGNVFTAEVAKPKRTVDSTRSSLARKLQQDSRHRRKKVMVKERARLKTKQILKTKMIREKLKKDKELERKRQARLAQLQKAKKTSPKPTATRSTKPFLRTSSSVYKTKIPVSRVPAKRSSTTRASSTSYRKLPISSKARTTIARKSTIKKPPVTTTRKPTKKTRTRYKKPRKPPAKKKVITKTAIKSRARTPQTTSRRPAQAYASTVSRNSYNRQQITLPRPQISKRTTTKTTARRKSTPKKSSATTKTVATQAILQYESYKDTKYVRNVSVTNLPARIDYGAIMPAIKIKWKRSIIQSMLTYPVIIEAEVSSLNKGSRFRKKAFLEKINLVKASLRGTCYLPIPININDNTGEFQVKFIVKDGKNRRILATEYRTFYRSRVARDKIHQISKLYIPPNQVGDSKISIKVKASKKNSRGKISIWGISQSGIMKLYEKKAKFKPATFSLDLPVLIPASMCSSKWYIYAVFNARGASIASFAKTSPPLSKIINLSFSGNPPLRQRVNSDFRSAITPKFVFKTRCEIHEVDILLIDNLNVKVLKRYRLRTRIKKGEKFVLEPFEWKSPSMRKGIFSSYKQKSVRLSCRIIDNLGEINESLIGIVETPTITVYKK